MDRDAAILPGYALEDFLTAPEHTGWSADTRDSYRRALQELYAYLQSAGPPGREGTVRLPAKRRPARARYLSRLAAAFAGAGVPPAQHQHTHFGRQQLFPLVRPV